MFFVLCHPRTGSHLLGSLLRSHPEIDFLSEPFKQEKHREGFDYIMSLPQSEFVGADIKYGRVNQLVDGLGHKIKDSRIIHLQRLDVLRTAISNIIAGTTLDPPLLVDRGEFDQIYNTIIFSSKAVAELYPDCFNVYYEDMTYGYWASTEKFQDVGQRKKLLEFIGVDDFELTTDMERDNPGDLRGMVKNYSEVLSWIK